MWNRASLLLLWIVQWASFFSGTPFASWTDMNFPLDPDYKILVCTKIILSFKLSKVSFLKDCQGDYSRDKLHTSIDNFKYHSDY